MSEAIVATLAHDPVDTRLKTIVAEILQLDGREQLIVPGANLFQLGLESLNVINLLTQVEMEFDIVVDVEDLSGELFEHYDRLLAFVQDKVGGR